MCRVESTFFGTRKYDYMIKTMGVFSFLPQINNWVTIVSISLLLSTLVTTLSNSVNVLCPPPLES